MFFKLKKIKLGIHRKIILKKGRCLNQFTFSFTYIRVSFSQKSSYLNLG